MITQPSSISPGGGRTSSDLNSVVEDLFESWQSIADTADSLSTLVERLDKRLTLQTSCYNTMLDQLDNTTSVPVDTLFLSPYALQGYGETLIRGESTALVLPEYGLVTTDMAVPDNQFCVKDAEGVPWVPSATLFKCVVLKDDASEPADADFETVNADLIPMVFDEDITTSWYVDLSEAPLPDLFHIWIEATLPMEHLFQTRTNGVTIHPLPEYGATLVGAAYKASGSGTWVDFEDLGSGEPARARMFLSADLRIEKVRFHYTMSATETLVGPAASLAFYVVHLGAYYFTWDASASLKLDLRPLLTDPDTGNYIKQLALTGHLVNGSSATVVLEELDEILSYKDGVSIEVTPTTNIKSISLATVEVTA